jgi:hypothetical protein
MILLLISVFAGFIGIPKIIENLLKEVIKLQLIL